VRDSGSSKRVFLSVVIALALLRVASDHAGLSARAGVATVGVDPGESDCVFLSGVSEAEADFVLALNLAVLLADALVALVGVGFAHSHRLVRHRVSAANVARAAHLASVGVAGASVSAAIAWLVEGLSSVVLNSIVRAFAVDAVVRHEICTVLRTGESGAAVTSSDDLTNGNHSSLVGAPTGHLGTRNGS